MCSGGVAHDCWIYMRSTASHLEPVPSSSVVDFEETGGETSCDPRLKRVTYAGVEASESASYEPPQSPQRSDARSDGTGVLHSCKV